MRPASGPAVEDLAAGGACTGTEIDDVIRAADHVVVVLDDHQRVAVVAQAARGSRSACPRREDGGRAWARRARTAC